MPTFQVWLVTAIEQESRVRSFMQMPWSWPIAESFHFLGLCLLLGAIGSFDLRLLGVGRRVPIAAMHRLIPWGLAGFAINITTGTLFVLTYPDQYIYNSAFQLKVLLLMIAGLNASMFYVTSYRRAFGSAAAVNAPLRAKVIAAVSLSAWIGVIVCGRLITFYRPAPCASPPTETILTCSP
jgi:hypothetical protein